MDTGTDVLRVNQSKLRRDFDVLRDIDAPFKEEPQAEAKTEAKTRSEPSSSSSDVTFLDKVWVAQTGLVHFQQLYTASSWLSSACADEGLRVAAPLDLRLVDKASADAFLIRFTESKPDLVYITLPPQKKHPEAYAWCWRVAMSQFSSG